MRISTEPCGQTHMINDDYRRVEQAIGFLREHAGQQPTVEALARELGLSSAHCQRLFRRWAGITPKRFLEVVTLEQAKRALSAGAAVSEAAWDCGLSGPSRLHDHFVQLDAVTPGEYKRAGAGIRIHWGQHASPFGPMFVGVTARGICALAFSDGDPTQALVDLETHWPHADIVEDVNATRAVADDVFAHEPTVPLPVMVRGTNFQVRVWQALLSIPAGAAESYGALARRLEMPGGARAVGRAVGANAVAWLIPCHRVLREGGELGGYRWGATRKAALLAWEAAQCDLTSFAGGAAYGAGRTVPPPTAPLP